MNRAYTYWVTQWQFVRRHSKVNRQCFSSGSISFPGIESSNFLSWECKLGEQHSNSNTDAHWILLPLFVTPEDVHTLTLRHVWSTPCFHSPFQPPESKPLVFFFSFFEKNILYELGKKRKRIELLYKPFNPSFSTTLHWSPGRLFFSSHTHNHKSLTGNGNSNILPLNCFTPSNILKKSIIYCHFHTHSSYPFF